MLATRYQNARFPTPATCKGWGERKRREAILALKVALIAALLFVNNAAATEQVVEKPAYIHNATEIPQPIQVDSRLPQLLPEAKTVAVQEVVTPKVTPPTGSHQDWMSAAGIAPSDYGYVEFIISHESSWNPNAINPTFGSCGLVQALPCSKLGADWSNPVVALRWGDSYAKSRYGGWAQAYSFWLKNSWW